MIDPVKIVSAGVLAAVVLTGCALPAATRPETVQGCAGAAAQAVRQHVTIGTTPAACRGLSPAELRQAVGDAIDEVSGGGPKAARRHRAYVASLSLGYLIAAAGRGAGLPPRRSRSHAVAATRGGQAGGPGVPAGIAALIAWLITAGSGSRLLGGWVADGGLRGARSRASGMPPVVVLSHFGLAIGGLAIWVGYLLSGVPAVAWTALLCLLPVTGLGIATLLLAIPDGEPPGGMRAIAPGGTRALPRDGRPAGDSQSGTVRAPIPVVLITVHGLFATATMLLVLLAAVAAG